MIKMKGGGILYITLINFHKCRNLALILASEALVAYMLYEQTLL